MKKSLSMLLILALLAVTPACAADASAVSLQVNGQSSAVIPAGQEAVVTLVLKSAGNTAFDLYSFQDYLCFNPDILQYIEGSLSVSAATNGQSAPLQASPLSFYEAGTGPVNRVFINRASSTAVSLPSGSTLLTFRLKALKLGDTALTHDTVELFQTVGVLLPVTVEAAQVTVTAASSGTGGGGGGGSSGGGGGGGGSVPGGTSGGGGAMAETPSEPRPDVVPLPFTDVAESDWFYSAVRFVYEQGLFTGTTSTLFQPNLTMNRAMLVTVFHRLAEEAPASAPVFSDVANDAWYAPAVGWAVEVGVADGYPDGRFGPEDPITREQMAALFYRCAAHEGLDGDTFRSLSQFTDGEQVSPWAADAVAWSVSRGLISGKEAGLLDPQGAATRAEVATILMRYLALLPSGA